MCLQFIYIFFSFETVGRMRERSSDEERHRQQRLLCCSPSSFSRRDRLRWSGAGDWRSAASEAMSLAGDVQQRHRLVTAVHLLLRPAQRVPQVPVAGATPDSLRPRYDQSYPFIFLNLLPSCTGQPCWSSSGDRVPTFGSSLTCLDCLSPF